MTRKCILCKETNYKNTYSFFSAPKDPEIRKKWQIAIAIENYAVTDDTYVCSKHFHKDDIITHWISGVPPHVISIKYKKCRLRPGAVPSRNFHREADKAHSDDSDGNRGDHAPFKLKKAETAEKDFLIPRTEAKLEINSDGKHRILSMPHQFPRKFGDFNYTLCRSSQVKTELPGNGLGNASLEQSKVKESVERSLKQTKENRTIYMKEDSINSNADLMEDTNSGDKKEEQSQAIKEEPYSPKKVSESSCEMFSISDAGDTSAQLWDSRTAKDDGSAKKFVGNNFKIKESFCAEKQLGKNLNYDRLDAYYPECDEIEEGEMLFEDLLEVCTEVLLPSGWSCVVTSKGHTTTIVYLFMGMTKAGMPFTERQVFINSDMQLHCAVINREINPLIYNLIREGKHLKVQSLVDVEEIIDEFDQRTLCQGVYNIDRFREIKDIKIAYKDGIKWRHILCPLILNNDSSRCTKCITLSHALQHKSKNPLSFPYTPRRYLTKQHKAYTIRERYKRTRKHDRRYEFIKVFKE